MMKQGVTARRSALVAALIATVIGTTACGVILYPERRGQSDGRIDAGVAILDGVGLLFGILPGVIAYAVDFSTGTIYLPGTADADTIDLNQARAIHIEPARLDAAAIEGVIRRRTGLNVSLTDPAMRFKTKSSERWRRLRSTLDTAQYAAFVADRPMFAATASRAAGG